MAGAHKRVEIEHATFDEFEAMLDRMPENERWELIDGRVVRGMVGARIEHHRIVGNIDFALKDHFRRRRMPCEALRETFWLQKKLLRLAVLPDVIVHCGQIAPGAVSLDDPLILVEVVSKDSDERDRVDKRRLYLKLPSLRHYAMVDRDAARIEVLDWTEAGWTGRRVLEGGTAVLSLPAIDSEMPLADVYHGVGVA